MELLASSKTCTWRWSTKRSELTLLDELGSRLPAECIQLDAEVVASYGQDRAVFEQAGSAAVLVMPRTTAEVVATVEAANAADVSIVPRGAGTGLTGAANAINGCIILSLHRMNEIVEIDTTNRMARVQPGGSSIRPIRRRLRCRASGATSPPTPAACAA
ncbi:MAG: FAD/FMN-containing dehydrogenase [Candidatus Poriferisodalaceae bacterium]